MGREEHIQQILNVSQLGFLILYIIYYGSALWVPGALVSGVLLGLL